MVYSDSWATELIQEHCAHSPSLQLSPQKAPSSLPVTAPYAAVTNHQKRSGLTQHKCILVQFRGSEVEQDSHWAKINVSAGMVPSEGSRGKSSPRFFWLPEAAPSVATTLQLLSRCHISFSDSDPPPLKTFMTTLGPTAWSKIISPSQKPWLNHICKVPFAM